MGQVSILFVDDEVNILRALQRLFIDEEYDILTAESGQAGLDLIDSGRKPAVIVSDQRMPGMNGAEFLAKVKEKLPDSTRIILTGYADINAAVDAINQGGTFRYILKPWEDEDLKITIREAIDRHGLIVKNKQLTLQLQQANTELEQLNENLENKVIERTRELNQAYTENLQLTEDLQKKVIELQAWDKIQKHLMLIHSLEDTLLVILDAMQTIAAVNIMRIYLIGNDEKPFYMAVSSLQEEQEKCNLQKKNMQPVDQKEHLFRQVLDMGEPKVLSADEVQTAGISEDGLILIPIQKGDRKFGVIEVIADQEKSSFDDHTIQVFFNLAMQAAVAVQDSMMDFELPKLKDSIDDVLADFQEFK